MTENWSTRNRINNIRPTFVFRSQTVHVLGRLQFGNFFFSCFYFLSLPNCLISLCCQLAFIFLVCEELQKRSHNVLSPVAEFIDPWLGHKDKVNSGIGLSYRTGTPGYMVGGSVRQPYTWVDFIPQSENYEYGFCISLPYTRIHSDSVADPDPDPPDPHVFGPPGSGSFYSQAKIVGKTLIPSALWLLFDFLSLKMI